MKKRTLIAIVVGLVICSAAFFPTLVPTISTISPTGIKAGSSSFTLTVNGTNFASNSVVRWNGADRPTTYVSPTRLTILVPSQDISTTATINITVFNPAPSGGVSNVAPLQVNNKSNTTTTILSHTPNPSATGATVTVTYAVTATSGTPTGTVTVSDGAASCSGSVSAGNCLITLTTVGTLTLTAKYSEDATFNDSSASVSHVVFGPISFPWIAKQPTPTPTPTPTPMPIANPVRNGGFEQGGTDWFAGTQIPWYADPVGDILARHRNDLPAPVAPHSGDWVAWLGGFPNSRTTLQTADPPFTVPSGGSTLRYWLWIQSDEPTCDLNNVDGAWVFFSTQAQQHTVDSFNLCTTNATNGWGKHDLDLSQFVGQVGWLSFVVRNIGENSNLFIDDVQMGTLAGAQFRPYSR